MLGLMVL